MRIVNLLGKYNLERVYLEVHEETLKSYRLDSFSKAFDNMF